MMYNLVDPLYASALNSKFKGFTITSGFRSERLNKAVGGVDNSAHKYGFAVDMQPKQGSVDEFYDWIKNWVRSNGRGYDQIIKETDGGTKWVHLGYAHAKLVNERVEYEQRWDTREINK